MRPRPNWLCVVVVCLILVPVVLAQSPVSENQSAASSAQAVSAAEVPRLIKFSGTLLDQQDRPMAGPVGVTFALHAQQSGGAALWMETQNVEPDARGNYTILLGANSAKGVPAELFVSGEARWLEVQVERQAAHERILLVSVPYALKAGDAETLGGKPASAFLTTETLTSAGTSAAAATATPGAPLKSSAATTGKKAASTPQFAACSGLTSNGSATINSIGLFTTACNIQSSVITQSGSNVGIGTAAPAVALDIVGNNAGLRLSGTGTHQVTVTGASSGRLGQDVQGFFFASDTNGKVIKFLTNNGALNEWMRITSAGNVGIGTTTPAAKLDINGNLNLPATASPTVGVISLGGKPFAHNFGPANSSNTFLGLSAGNFTSTGSLNTASGFNTMTSNTTGNANSAFGNNALLANTTGDNNAAFGTDALRDNTSGGSNAALGTQALLANTTGSQNAAFGAQALLSNTTGIHNAAFGYDALTFTTADSNSAFGAFALSQNTTGGSNAAFGALALSSNTTACCNAAFGAGALQNNKTGGANSAFGFGALQNNTAGMNNTAFGTQALGNLVGGNSNIAIGFLAGSSLTGSEGNNIYLGSNGSGGESTVIRIGTVGLHAAAFMAGISGVTTGLTAAPVLVDGNGQLGTISSSRRFKYDIDDMGQASNDLLRLRPVTFRYKQAQTDGSHPLQYGLIAEEVAQVYPELVQYAATGEVNTVLYHLLPAMLLNEVQKQHGQIEAQGRQIQAQREQLQEIAALKQQNAQLRQQLLAISVQVKQIRNEVEAASAKPETAARDSGSAASAVVTEASTRKAQALP